MALLQQWLQQGVALAVLLVLCVEVGRGGTTLKLMVSDIIYPTGYLKGLHTVV